jgi:signal transduction histidine kinase
LRLDLRTHRATFAGSPLALRTLEFELLAELARNAGRVVTRDRLLDRVWGSRSPAERVRSTSTSRTLRKKLGRPTLIQTVRGVGYRLLDGRELTPGTRLRLRDRARPSLAAVSLSLLAARISCGVARAERLRRLRRQVALLAHETCTSARRVRPVLATQDERLSVLPRQAGDSALPTGQTVGSAINGRKYLYATQEQRARRRRAPAYQSSVRAENEPFWIALAAAAALGCVLAARRRGAAGAEHRAPVCASCARAADSPRGSDPGSFRSTGSRELRELAESFNSMARSWRVPAAPSARSCCREPRAQDTLTAIRAYSEALDDGVVDAEARREGDPHRGGPPRTLISDLINLARLDQRRFDINPSRRPGGGRTRERDAPRAHGARARRPPRARRRRSGSALADGDRLLQAVSNLVENALRCTPPGGTVTLSAAPGRPHSHRHRPRNRA